MAQKNKDKELLHVLLEAFTEKPDQLYIDISDFEMFKYYSELLLRKWPHLENKIFQPAIQLHHIVIGQNQLNKFNPLFYSNQNKMEVSSDVLENEILSQMNLIDILNTCQSNRQLNILCQRDSFWRQLVERDYPKDLIHKPQRIKWKQYYMDLYTNPTVPVYFGLNRFAEIKLNPHWIDLEYVKQVIVDHGMNHHPIVFTDGFITPLAFYNKEKLYRLINQPVRKVVIYPSDSPLSESEILKTLTTDYFGGNNLYGYVTRNQDLLVGYQPITNPTQLQPCHAMSISQHKQIANILRIAFVDDFCSVLYTTFKQQGRIINQV